MSELSTQLSEPEPYDQSTQLDEGRGTSEGQPSKEPEFKESRLEAIKRAAEDVKPKEDVKVDEPKAEKSPEKVEAEPAKTEAQPEEKPTPEVKAETVEKPRRQPIEAPSNFVPRAKELWANTPHEVRADMQRVISEASTRAEQAEASVKEYEAIKPYAEYAKQNGTTIDQAMGRFINMENSLRSNPTEGFRGLLHNMQLNPVQAIGHILQAYNVRPEQLAAHISQNPDDYTSLARPQQPQQQPNGDVQALKQQIAEMQQSMVQRDVHSTVVEPFARENPRYYDLEPTIAAFLNSDMVPKSLSPHDRLAAAYDMAVRISPSSKTATAPQVEEANEDRAGKDFGGDKSVRGAPSSGVDTTNNRRGKMSRGEALKAAVAELGLAH